jgi:c-di-GMP-binding flagellar brake protein YcgR
MSAHEDILGLHEPQQSDAPAYAVSRRFERVRLKLHIRVHRTINGKAESFDGQAQDVSEGGLGAYVPADLQLHEAVRIEGVLPFGRKPIIFDAEVRDCRGFRFGFEFVKMAEADRETLRQALSAFAVSQ